MGLKHSYMVFTPIYDLLVGGTFDSLRKNSISELQRLPLVSSKVTNVVFEEILSHCTDLQILEDIPIAVNGWFRRIVLQKTLKPCGLVTLVTPSHQAYVMSGGQRT